LRLLAYRDRSERELLDRLARKGFSAEAAHRVTELLKSLGFIDDRRFAAHLRRLAIESKHLGRRGTEQFLLKRGIAPEMVQEMRGSDDDYLDAALALIEKKMRRTTGPPGGTSEMRRLWGLLARRGFSAETIGRALKSFEAKEE
jgi:regulatory protein